MQLLMKETFRNTGLMLSTIENPRHMISNKILRTFLVPSFTIKFLYKDLSQKFRFGILLRMKVLKNRVVSINNHMRPNQLRSKFFKTKYHSQRIFLNNSIIQLGIIHSMTSIINDMGLPINTLSSNNSNSIVKGITH